MMKCGSSQFCIRAKSQFNVRGENKTGEICFDASFWYCLSSFLAIWEIGIMCVVGHFDLVKILDFRLYWSASGKSAKFRLSRHCLSHSFSHVTENCLSHALSHVTGSLFLRSSNFGWLFSHNFGLC